MKARFSFVLLALLSSSFASSQGPAEKKPLDNPRIPAQLHIKKADRETALLLFNLSLADTPPAPPEVAYTWSNKILEIEIRDKVGGASESNLNRLRSLLAKQIEGYEKEIQLRKKFNFGDPDNALESWRYRILAAQFYYLEASEQRAIGKTK